MLHLVVQAHLAAHPEQDPTINPMRGEDAAARCVLYFDTSGDVFRGLFWCQYAAMCQLGVDTQICAWGGSTYSYVSIWCRHTDMCQFGVNIQICAYLVSTYRYVLIWCRHTDMC